MQIVNNALSKNLLNKTTQEILTLQKEKVWVTNIQKWQSNLTRGMNGSCLQCDIPDTTANNILEAQKYIEIFNQKISNSIFI